MGKVNVYLPDGLEAAVREAGLPLSSICQTALRDALHAVNGIRATGRGAYTAHLVEILDGLRARQSRVTALDVLRGIFEHGDNLGARTLASLGVDLPVATGRAARRAGGAELADDALDLLADAYRVSAEMRHPVVGTEHVVIASAADGTPLADLYLALGIDQRGLRQQVERLLATPWSTERPEPVDNTALLERLEGEVQRLAAELGRLRDD